jgi:hypothetical protein
MASVRARPALLSRVLRYRNQRVIDSFRAAYRVPRREAEGLFLDMLRFLWLTTRSQRRGEAPLPVLRAQAMLDEMWHTFVLHTRDYHSFCTRHFGVYVHHTPASPRERRRPVGERALDRVLRTVIDELGPEAAVRWYETYPRRYSLERIERLRRPLAARR